MTTLTAHKAQVVLVEPGTIIQTPEGQEDTVTNEKGAQCGNTFFMTRSAWDETRAKDQSLEALVLTPDSAAKA